MSSIQSASRRTGLSPGVEDRLARRHAADARIGEREQQLRQRVRGPDRVGVEDDDDLRRAGRVARRPAAIAARLPAFGIRSTWSQ